MNSFHYPIHNLVGQLPALQACAWYAWSVSDIVASMSYTKKANVTLKLAWISHTKQSIGYQEGEELALAI